ncbi:MAG: HypC/HybG/HupF family hydrogenase formation chaperone [Acidobacteria bacterium]|nr:HypC/HybG/HupF family hydrogenase formation chaperone [Acidobacteriota bacterium]
MCLGVPGEVLNVQRDPGSGLARGEVRFGGIVKEVNLSYTPEVQPGDYVVVHVGFSISRLNEAEAKKALRYLNQIGALSEQLPDEPPSPE